jgi:outer membrane lipoprotein-sorting protein
VIDIIKTIPNDVDNDVVLTTFWIDEKKLEIRKMEMNTKSGGTFQVELDYNNLPYDLPQKLNVVFDMKGMDMPKNFNGEIPKEDKTGKEKAKGKGTVTITYANYKVNTGLDDKIFKDNK